MNIDGSVAVVSGGASGLGRACVTSLADRGAKVVVLDIGDPDDVSSSFPSGMVTFVATDVTDPAAVARGVATAEALGDLRILIHTAGIGGRVRPVEKDGTPGDPGVFERVVRVNLIGTFIVLSTAAAAMSRTEPRDGERGVAVLTSSIAAFDGQIGQSAYAASKGGVASLTLACARDLSRKLIRVSTIAPGTFDTPLLGRLREDVRASLEAQTPHPARLGTAAEFASLATHIVENPMLNGETIRLDGALRMPPR